MTDMMKYRSIFISDVHLGSKSCKAEQLNNFLRNNESEFLFLVGDIIDGWKVKQNKWKWDKTQTKVIRTLLKISTSNTKIIFIPGNHDEFLRPLLGHDVALNGLELHNQYIYTGIDGKRYLVTHGDLFDGITGIANWLAYFGDTLYDFVLWLNTYFNKIRRKFGFNYWSLSKYLKHQVKQAVDFVFEFEKRLADYCKRKGYDGVICGHIHHAEIKIIDNIIYMNDGDWVESCTALVEHLDGQWELITWIKDEKDNEIEKINSNN